MSTVRPAGGWVCECAHPQPQHRGVVGGCVHRACGCTRLRVPGRVEGEVVNGVLVDPALTESVRREWPWPCLTVEETNPGDDSVHLWAYVPSHAGEPEQRGVSLDADGVARLVATLAARLPLLAPPVVDAEIVGWDEPDPAPADPADATTGGHG